MSAILMIAGNIQIIQMFYFLFLTQILKNDQSNVYYFTILYVKI